jgi:hypothetical protein
VRTTDSVDDTNQSMLSEFAEIGLPPHYEDWTKMGVDPAKSTRAKPGTEEKVRVLSARYAAGLSLWHTRDRHDHGPKESELRGMVDSLVPPLPLPESDEPSFDENEL